MTLDQLNVLNFLVNQQQTLKEFFILELQKYENQLSLCTFDELHANMYENCVKQEKENIEKCNEEINKLLNNWSLV